MADGVSDFKRVVSASGVYATAAIAQRGLSFLLLPIYTRLIDPAEYGVLELLTALSSIIFGTLMMGLPSAVMKCYHRDCQTPGQRAALLPTAIGLAAPVLLVGTALLFVYSSDVSVLLVGPAGRGGELLRLVLATGILSGLTGLLLANLRAEERAVAFSALTVTQFAVALSLNVILVVHYQMGVRGILWGNLASHVIAFPVACLVSRRNLGFRFDPRLVDPLLRFGLLLIPVVLSSWIINVSDRYVLRLFTDLSEVAVYGVGYKFGMIIELTLVWPFQLAWPAVSFSISHRPGHRQTYAKALTYLTTLIVYFIVGLSLLTRVGLLVVVGESYRGAYRVIPLIALAYGLNGIQYCVSPGVHISKKTRYLTYISMGAAAINLVLNFAMIPRWGMMGAACSTVVAFALVAAVTFFVSLRFYAVEYEYSRLLKVCAIGLGIFLIATQVKPSLSLFSVIWHIGFGVFAFPAALFLSGFFDHGERSAIRTRLDKLTSRFTR